MISSLKSLHNEMECFAFATYAFPEIYKTIIEVNWSTGDKAKKPEETLEEYLTKINPDKTISGRFQEQIKDLKSLDGLDVSILHPFLERLNWQDKQVLLDELSKIRTMRNDVCHKDNKYTL